MPNGYRMAILCVDATYEHFYVHRLVMQAFVGVCAAGQEVNHKNGCKADNHLPNLEFTTRSGNMQHAHGTGLIPKRPSRAKVRVLKGRPQGDSHWTALRPQDVPRGEAIYNCKVTDEQVEEIRARVAAGEVQRKLCKEYNLSPAQVCRIVAGTRRKTL